MICWDRVTATSPLIDRNGTTTAFKRPKSSPPLTEKVLLRLVGPSKHYVFGITTSTHAQQGVYMVSIRTDTHQVFRKPY